MSSAGFVQMFRKYCCCKGTSSMDYERLVAGADQGDQYTIANTNGVATLTGSSRAGLSESGSVSQSRSREEEEEELMNKILDRTQQCIIDVTNLENCSLDFDLTQRSRLYSAAVMRHDAATERRRGLLSNDGGGADNFGTVSAVPSLLVSIGPLGSELVSSRFSPPMTSNELTQISQAGGFFRDIHRLGDQIECKEELIVYMSWDE